MNSEPQSNFSQHNLNNINNLEEYKNKMKMLENIAIKDFNVNSGNK